MDEKDLFNSPIEKNMGHEDIGDEDGSSKLFESIKDKGGKVGVSITLDRQVLEDIETYKKENKISSLSPTINIILKDWLKRNLRKSNGKKKRK